MGKLMCVGQTSLATTVRGTITIAVPRVMRPWRLSVVGHVAPGTRATAFELQIESISCGGQPLTHNGSASPIPWGAYINSEGDAWDLTIDFGDDLSDVPTCTGDAAMSIVLTNQNGGTVLCSAVAAMMD